MGGPGGDECEVDGSQKVQVGEREPKVGNSPSYHMNVLNHILAVPRNPACARLPSVLLNWPINSGQPCA